MRSRSWLIVLLLCEVVALPFAAAWAALRWVARWVMELPSVLREEWSRSRWP